MARGMRVRPGSVPVLLVAVGLGLAVLEVFFPSAGTLAVLSFASLVAAILLGFRQGPGLGMVIFAAVCVAALAIVVGVVFVEQGQRRIPVAMASHRQLARLARWRPDHLAIELQVGRR